MNESKNPPNKDSLFLNLAIAPSIPSNIPVIKMKIAHNRKLLKTVRVILLRKAKNSISDVAKLGDTPILLKNLAKKITRGLNTFLNLSFELIIRG